MVWPFSGANSDYGPEGLAGAELALKEAGHRAGGHDVELIRANEDVLDPSKTLEDVKRLVLKDGASILLGPAFGSSQQAIDPYLRTSDVMSFVPYGITEELGGTGNAIGWPTLDTQFSAPLGQYMVDELDYDTIATVGADYVYGHNVLQGVIDSFEDNGGDVIQEQWIPLSATDLLPYASNLNQEADALVMWLVPQDTATFVKDLRSLGIDIPIIFVNGIFDPTFQSIAPEIEGSLGLVDWSAGLDNDENEEFVDGFRKDNDGAYPTTNNAAGYMDMKLALETIEATNGSTDMSDLKAAVRNLELDTPYGSAHFDENYFAVTSRTIVKVAKDNDRYMWEPVKTFDNVPNEDDS